MSYISIVPAVYIPPVEVEHEDVFDKVAADAALKVYGLRMPPSYDDHNVRGFELTRWAVKVMGGVPFTFTHRQQLVFFKPDEPEHPDIPAPTTARPDNIAQYTLRRYYIQYKPVGGGAEKCITHEYFSAEGQWFPEKVKPTVWGMNKVPDAQLAEFYRAAQEDLEKAMAERGFVQGSIDYTAVAQAIADKYAPEQ